MNKQVLKVDDHKKSYSDAAYFGNIAFVSGQMSLDENNQPVPGTIAEEAERALTNLRDVVEKLGATMEDVLFTSVNLLSNDDFPGFNETYVKFFPKNPPARITVVVKELYGGLKIEITAVVALNKK